MIKVYDKYYTVILNNEKLVVWACGSDDWQLKYKPAPGLNYFPKYAMWSMEKKYAK